MKVIITVVGGLVQQVEAPPGITVEVLDFDTDHKDAENLCHCSLAVDGEFHFHSTFGEEQPL